MLLNIKLPIFILVLLITNGIFAQIPVSGRIVNLETGEGVSYAKIKKKDSNKGAITNEDGYFQMVCETSDTLVITSISYDKKEVAPSYFKDKEICYLTPSVNELQTVEVFSDLDYLYTVFERANKGLRKAKNQKSKTYFTVESSSEGIPLELLECYYNAKTGPSGVLNVELKNGRIGMSKLDNTYYASLYSSYIVSNYDLLYEKENQFPENPLQQSMRQLKGNYKLRLLGVEDNIYIIKFTPKKEHPELFESTFWIDKSAERIIKIQLTKLDLKKHPLVEISTHHKISELNFTLDYTFSNTQEQMLEKIEVKYDLLYDNMKEKRRIETNGVFLFYEPNSSFDLPHYSQTGEELSDYDKIVAQPYNELFWTYNEVLSPSEKTHRYRRFFKENGILLNFDELEQLNEDAFKNKLEPWSTDRVFLNDLGQGTSYDMSDVVSILDYHRITVLPRGDLYHLVGHIYLDRNEFEDSVHYLSRTLIDKKTSFFKLNKTKYSVCMLNLYFDLIEIKRRELMETLESSYWTTSQSDSIYKVTQISLGLELRRLIVDSDYGSKEKVILTFNEKVQNELKFGNENLIVNEEFMQTDKDGNPIYKAKYWYLYSYANNLYESGEYKKAVNFFLKAQNIGANDSWLYYMIGSCFLKLDMPENACQFLLQSRELGEDVKPELLKDCFD